ncbi:MAG: ABC transporter substrate-binding protein [Firmicutes bacterium]|nr:ABC transporter substrate-binding protein [Bacillota bacterium]
MRIRSKAIALCMVMALVLAIGVAGCGKAPEKKAEPAPTPAPAPSPAPKPVKETIVIALQGEPSTLDPQFADDGNMRAVTENVFEPLLTIDGKTLKPILALAESYKTVNPTTWEFKIRKGIKWQNGDALTVDDVVFSVLRQIDPKFKSQIASNFRTIKDARKVDESTVNIITDGPDPALPVRLTGLMIVNKKHVEAVGDTVGSKPIGTGPYKVIEWKKGVSISVEAFDGYWGNKPSVKKGLFRFIEEGSTRLSALKANEIDVAVNMLPEYIKDVPKVASVEGLEFPLVRFLQFKGVMKNPLIRQAANYAIDKEAIAKSLYGGYASPALGQMFKPGYVGFNSELKPYPYDPNKAKELLKQAGYKGEKIQMVAQRGRWLKDGELAEAVSMLLRDAGMNVELKYYDWNGWLKVLFDRNLAPDMIVSFHSNDLFDADRTFSALVHSKGTMSSYLSADLDKKIDAARTEMDSAKRQKMYEEVGKVIYDDPAFIFLVNIKDIYGLSKSLDWQPRQDGKKLLSEMRIVQ